MQHQTSIGEEMNFMDRHVMEKEKAKMEQVRTSLDDLDNDLLQNQISSYNLV